MAETAKFITEAGVEIELDIPAEGTEARSIFDFKIANHHLVPVEPEAKAEKADKKDSAK